VTKNKAGRCFFTLYGNTFPIKDKLGKKGLGFHYFQGRWSKPVDKISQDERSVLDSLGIDTSPLDNPQCPMEGEGGQNQQLQPQVTNKEKVLSPIDMELAKMKAGVDKAIEEAEGRASEKAKQILKHVDNMIERLATQVDEASAQEFVKSFLKFSAKFHNYSFGNQILIWIQKPDATKVSGAKAWFNKFGREVINWNNPIHIIAPRQFITDEGKNLKEKISKDQWNRIKDKYTFVYFTGAKVYDISDTKPVPGWKGQGGEGPYDPIGADWRKDPNEKTEEIELLINSAIEWAKEVGIDVKSEKMRLETGGFSAGGKIRINNEFEGINKFSTLIHELAHEVLHWSEEGQKERDKISRKVKEIDAETTAYIVLEHYGFETKDTPNYIALWGGAGEEVKSRRENIAKAVKIIINGIDKQISRSDIG